MNFWLLLKLSFRETRKIIRRSFFLKQVPFYRRTVVMVELVKLLSGDNVINSNEKTINFTDDELS